MTTRTAVRIGRAIWAGGMVCLLLSIGLQIPGRLGGHLKPHSIEDTLGGLGLIALMLMLLTLGALIVARRPGNAIGWMFCGIGFVLCLTFLADAYVSYSISGGRHGLPGVGLAAWFSNMTQGPALFTPFIFLFLLFPNGRLLSPAWRPVAWFGLVDTLAMMLYWALRPGPLNSYPSLRNPLGIGPLGPGFQPAIGLVFVLFLVTLLAAIISLMLRFRRSRGEDRQQLKWFASATALVAIVVVSAPITWQLPGPVWTIAFFAATASVPVSIAIAMLKYRLYDIDVIINRALVYGPLTAALAAIYVGAVIVLQALFRTLIGQESGLAVAISTLVIAALFQPFRRSIQSFIDHRFYRRKYDAAQALTSFQGRLRNEVDLDQLSDDLLSVVRDTVQPTHVSLWLRR